MDQAPDHTYQTTVNNNNKQGIFFRNLNIKAFLLRNLAHKF